MNKLHEALKNEELMLEVGRKATEEQKAMTQSTVEEQYNQIVDGIDKDEVEYEHGWWETSTGASFGKGKKKELWDLIQLAEQKAREEERERIVDIIEKHKKNIKEHCVCVPGEENCHVCQSKYHDDDLQDIINQITNSK